MAALLEEWGVTGRILGVTPKLVGASRGDEIQAWIQLNKGTKYQAKQFVILDDDTDMGKLKSNLVQTQGHVGLTMADAEKAIAMLL
jgi:hypothetical protein